MFGALLGSVGGGLLKRAVGAAGGLLKKAVGSATGKAIARHAPAIGNVLTGVGIGAGAAPVLRAVTPALPQFPGMPPLPQFPGIGSKSHSGGSYDASGRRRYRRMNPGNAKALRRAARRLEAGEKLFRRIYAIRHGNTPRASSVTPKSRKRRAS